MPGTILAVHVTAGDTVTAGQPVLVVEAMKMEHTVTAPVDGTVTELTAKAGQQVRMDETLAVIEPGTPAMRIHPPGRSLGGLCGAPARSVSRWWLLRGQRTRGYLSPGRSDPAAPNGPTRTVWIGVKAPMLSYKLDEEHEDLRKGVAEFARDVVAPVIGELYEREKFPYDIVAQMGRMGLFGLPVPEEHGGMGGDYLALCLALEELARVDSSVAITLEAGVGLGIMPIYRFGSEAQKREAWLPALCAGEKLSAFGLTEPGGGTDVAGAMRTRARLEDGEWVIDGSKSFITNSGTSITAVVGVRRRDRRHPAGRQAGDLHDPGAVLRTPGFTVAPKYSKVGWACSDTHELSFSGCRVPEANLLGERGRGYAQFLRTLDEGRIAIAALSTGLAQGCVDESLAYVRGADRVRRPDRAGSRRCSSRSPTWRRAPITRGSPGGTRRPRCWPASRSRRKPPSRSSPPPTRRWTTRAGRDADLRRVRLVMNEFAVGRFYRDAKILEVGEGTSEVQRMLIARELGSPRLLKI